MPRPSLVRVVVAVALVCWSAGHTPAAAPPPRFTEEREAAALHFVRKHCPELLPLLEELKKNNRPAYELQIRETFKVTELLADLRDDPKRYTLELKVWVAENRALVLVARLATARDEDRKAIEDQLHVLARELVELDVRGMEYRVEVLERELAMARDDLTKGRDNLDRSVKERYDGLLEKAKRKRPG
jgi:hypothetical protein